MDKRADRIKVLIETLGISQTELATKSGIASSNMANMIGKGYTITDKTLQKISNAFPQVNLKWLKTGEGEMIKSIEESNATILGPYVEPELGNPGVFRIPSLPIAAQATFVESITDNVSTNPLEDFKDVQLLPEEIPIKDSLTTIQVDGESMERTLIDGAWVLTRRVKNSQWGNIGGVVFVSYGELFVVKRIKSNKLFSENFIVLESDNKEYGEMTVQLSDIHAMWKAMRIISSPIL